MKPVDSFSPSMMNLMAEIDRPPVPIPLQKAQVFRLSTPVRIIFDFVVIIVASFLLYYFSANAIDTANAGIKGVESDSTPSIDLAQEIRLNLSDLDGAIINQFLDPDHFSKYSGVQTNCESTISHDVVEASKNITYPGEDTALQTLVQSLTAYEDLMGQARGEWDDHLKDEALKNEAKAEGILHLSLVTSADELDRINSAGLESSYNTATNINHTHFVEVLLMGSVLCGYLIYMQIWLTLKTRRMINPGLLVATFSVAIFTTCVLAALTTSKEDLRRATMDAYGSIHPLEKAKAISTDANGAKSRWLFEGSKSETQSDHLFHQLALELANQDAGGKSYTELANELRQAGVPLRKEDVANFGLTDGYLVEELNNITYGSVEQNDAIACLESWGAYLEADGKLRDLESQGKHQEAIDFCLGESDRDFGTFTRNLDATIDVNRDAFKEATKEGHEALGNLNWWAPGLALLVIALSALGLWPRLNEYHE